MFSSSKITSGPEELCHISSSAGYLGLAVRGPLIETHKKLQRCTAVGSRWAVDAPVLAPPAARAWSFAVEFIFSQTPVADKPPANPPVPKSTYEPQRGHKHRSNKAFWLWNSIERSNFPFWTFHLRYHHTKTMFKKETNKPIHESAPGLKLSVVNRPITSRDYMRFHEILTSSLQVSKMQSQKVNSSAHSPSERVVKALLSRTVEAKVWLVAARALQSVRDKQRIFKRFRLNMFSPTHQCYILNIPTKRANMSTAPLTSGHRAFSQGPCIFYWNVPFAIDKTLPYSNIPTSIPY